MIKNFKINIRKQLVIIVITWLIFYNQFLFLQLKNVYANKAFQFLEVLNIRLKDLEKKKLEDSFDLDQKVVYKNYFDNNLYCYDMIEFNNVFTNLYHESIIRPKIDISELYVKMVLCCNIMFLDSEYKYHKDLFNHNHFLSWFFRSLRRVQKEKNLFNIFETIKEFPKNFLEREDSDIKLGDVEYLNFFYSYLSLLVENKVIRMQYDYNFSFFDTNESQRLIFTSFEPLVFGKYYTYDIKNCDPNLDPELLANEKKDYLLEDFIFNYVVASTSNCVNYDRLTNNTFIDFDVKDIKKKYDSNQ